MMTPIGAERLNVENFQRKASLAIAAVAFGAAAMAQNPITENRAPENSGDRLTFEVASIKPSGGPAETMRDGVTNTSWGTKGGPGTNDPTRWSCTYCDLASRLAQAYGVKAYQLTYPGWMNSEHYDMSAKVPAGTTKEQFAIMLRNLLEERFQFKLHRETKDIPGYDLVVGKGGPKLTQHVVSDKEIDPSPKSADGEPEEPGARLRKMMEERRARGGLQHDADGYPMPLEPNCKSCMTTSNGKTTMLANGQTMQELAQRLTMMLGKPVVDKTGLTGSYDFKVRFERGDTMGMGGQAALAAARTGRGPASSGDAAPPVGGDDPGGGPTLQGAMEKQLGLKLEPKKQTLETVVIDRAAKVPTEN
jgi:uncharacterized protein (TIGR03435 family)